MKYCSHAGYKRLQRTGMSRLLIDNWRSRSCHRSQPDAWRYIREIQDAGKPADASGYR
jgi:hypothetical protein